jgi:DNA polymerase-3 subunit gamma/tau
VRTLIEIALVRICNLEDLDAIPELVARLQGTMPAAGQPARMASPPQRASTERTTESGGQKKKGLGDAEPLAAANPQPPAAQAPSAPPAADRTSEFSEQTAEYKWRAALEEIGGLTAECAGDFESLAISAPNLLVVRLKTAYNKDWCERVDVKRRLEQVMSRLAGRDIRIDFAAPASQPSTRSAARPPAPSRLQRMREAEQNPLVQEAISLFDAEIVRVDQRRQN